MTDFGLDLSCTDDLDPLLGEVTGVELIKQAVHRRLITPRGQLIDDPDYGLDLFSFLSADMTAAELATIPSQVDGEILKEDEVSNSTTTATWDPRTSTLTLDIACETALGPFSLVLPVSQVTVAALGGS